MYYVHKYEVAQQYGGQEEGGWWFDTGNPVWRFPIPVPFKELAYKICRWLNDREYKRQEAEEEYGYTSVLSYRSHHYSYGVEDHFTPKPFPEYRPHYE